jgi:ABC-type transport system, involved in lipoprotein release, permease component
MYILKNALQNIRRNKGRNILISIILFAVIATTVVTLMINTTTESIINDYKSRFGAQVNISVDIEKFLEINGPPSGDGAMALPRISASQSIIFANSEYIKEYTMRISKDITSDDLVGIDEGSSENMMTPGSDVTLGKFMLMNQFDDFDDGQRVVSTGGRMLENDNECLISEEFAALNNLSVNDMINVYADMTNTEDGSKRTVQYTLTIVGIYYDFTQEYSSIQMSLSNRRNEILTTTETLVSSMNANESGLSVNATYFLKHPSMLEDFEMEIREKGLDDYMAVSTDEGGYNKIVSPVEGLKKIAVTFLIVVLILGALILILLSTIAMRERKYEIGVLRAMGMKKGKVALGLLSEMLILTVICLVIGLSVGVVTAQPVANSLLTQQIEAAKSTNIGGPIMIGGTSDGGTTNVEPLSEIDIQLSTNAIIQIMGISLLLATLTSVVGISFITKYEPIKILMERN